MRSRHATGSKSSSGNLGEQNAGLIAPDRRRRMELSEKAGNSLTLNDSVDTRVKHR
jgi:hypothetical protein